jgi:hypothetical protein
MRTKIVGERRRLILSVLAGLLVSLLSPSPAAAKSEKPSGKE